jgi:hypothetical protein
VRLRINGKLEILDFEKSDWVPHASGVDLAVCPLDKVLDGRLVGFIPRSMYENDEMRGPSDFDMLIGPGDDIFMLGRFLPLDGVESNEPVYRFGNIASWPARPIRNPHTRLDEQSFIVEMRSRNGFSGSVVFANITAGSVRPFWAARGQTGLTQPPPAVDQHYNYVSFIGIDWGHLPDLESGLSTAMATVIPDYRLIELLDGMGATPTV